MYVTCVAYVTMLPDGMRCTTAGLEHRIIYSLSDLSQKIAAGGGIQVLKRRNYTKKIRFARKQARAPPPKNFQSG